MKSTLKKSKKKKKNWKKVVNISWTLFNKIESLMNSGNNMISNN